MGNGIREKWGGLSVYISVAKSYPALLQDIISITSALTQERLGAEPDEGEAIGIGVADGIRKIWGRCSVYVAKVDAKALADKNKEVFEAWSQGGGFSQAFCQRFNLSEQRLRQIVAKERVRAEKVTVPYSPSFNRNS